MAFGPEDLSYEEKEDGTWSFEPRPQLSNPMSWSLFRLPTGILALDPYSSALTIILNFRHVQPLL
jgi:hypothetical protein